MGTITFLTNIDKEEIDSRLANLEYVPIDITSFKNSVGTVEIGKTVDNVKFTWDLNRTPKILMLDDMSISPEAREITLSNLSIKENKRWMLKAIDEKDHEDNSNTMIEFYYGVYYGVSNRIIAFNNEKILALIKVLTTTKNRTINVSAGTGKYIYYCVPTRFGTCNFNVGGFDGGFNKVKTFDFTNTFGHTESYDVYESTNSGLGSTTVKIT